jgi:CheY-like chemotaxis protein
VVIGRAKMIASGETDTPADIRDQSRVVAKQAQRIANNIRSLLDFSADNAFDLVISDHRMPGFTGLEVLEELRGEPVQYFIGRPRL